MSIILSSEIASVFGDMKSGAGVISAFDQVEQTTCYAQSTSGYVGVKLNTSLAIDYVEVVSAVNGFDASGLETPVTISLYGKSGTAPTSSNDGVVISSISFNDVNEVHTKVITSPDKTTKFDYVWVLVTSGVWAVVGEVRVFAARIEDVVIPTIGPQETYMVRSCLRAIPLPQAPIEIQDFRAEFLLTETRVVTLDFHTDFIYIENGFGGVIGMGIRLFKKTGSDAESMRDATPVGITSAVGGCNILNITHHYGNKAVTAALELPAGYHQISLQSSAHTTGTSNGNLGMIHPEYNQLRIKIAAVGAILLA